MARQPRFRSLVSEVAPRAPRYAECNVNETGHGSGGAVYTCLCGGQHASGQRAECSHTVGVQTVSTLPYFDRVPSKGAPAPDFWRYNLAQRIGGQWQYTREWDLPDMWAFLTALNLTAAQIPPHPSGDLVPVDQCKPLFEWGSGEMNWFPQVAADA